MDNSHRCDIRWQGCLPVRCAVGELGLAASYAGTTQQDLARCAGGRVRFLQTQITTRWRAASALARTSGQANS